ncbi:MAG TPA: 2Fe-2S iron-sulfur cluster-binding protein, partial [Polyangiaceae bacterium]|nr:2Fe-2S iron-sulfur cluster-binding protein [Polyangiaceae bacterium]
MRIDFEGTAYELSPGEPLLSGLERRGVQLPSFCRTGVCQTCLVKAKRGRPPPLSQVGLKEVWVAQGLFLACMCVPEEPLEIERCEAASSFDSRIERVEQLSPSVLRVELQAPAGFEYRAGQFVQLERASGVMRPYSLASVPGSDRLELHVALFPGGEMSQWLITA